MPKKNYNCNECGYMFPEELSELIEKKIQVYCEKCGKPFSIKGVVFKPATIHAPAPLSSSTREKKGEIQKPSSRVHHHHEFAEKDRERFDRAIRNLNKFSSIPILIVSIILLVLTALNIAGTLISINYVPAQYFDTFYTLVIQNTIFGTCGLLISIYDIKYLSSKIKEKKYNEIVVDSFCWGIVACVIYGAGVILIFKGVAILIYNILDNKHFGHNLKNSLNHFSARLGAIILVLAASSVFTEPENLQNYSFITNLIFLSIAIVVLYIDHKYEQEIKEKNSFFANDAVLFFILGILGVMFGAAGIFILFKGILFIFLIHVKSPEEAPVATPVEEMAKDMVHEIKTEEITEKRDILPPLPREEPQQIELTKKQVKELKEHAKKTEKLKKDLEKKPTLEKEIELKLHESLLPVKDEKDKELVKQYFTRIFSVLSKEIKNQINDLNISKKEKKELLKELAFLTREEQLKYIDAIVELYQEIPKKLINRIKKLPNVKPTHYEKIVEQLKFLDVEEQVRYVQFLEENA